MWSIPVTHPKTVSQSGRTIVFTKPHGSQTIVGVPCRWLHFGRRAHQQECLPSIYLPVEASPENNFTTRSHAPISGPALKFTRRRVAARVTLFLHTPPPTGASAADKPIHPLHAPRRSRKISSFSVFLSGNCYCVFLSLESPLFLCFLELYDIFRTLGVVSVDSY